MEETFNALEGSLSAVYGTDLDRGVDYVDALLWVSEDFRTSYYIVGSEVVDGSSEDYIDSKMYDIPDTSKEEVILLMMDFEGRNPNNPNEPLLLNDIISITTRD